MDKLFAFCSRPDGLGVRYDMQIARPDAVMVTLVIPGAYLDTSPASTRLRGSIQALILYF
jgi:hypothetical protein